MLSSAPFRLTAIIFFVALTAFAADTPQPVHYWDLPTGSHIAYLHYSATPPAKPTPIVFLHGGPGAYLVDHPPSVSHFYQSLAKFGFDVYLYDQIGSGRSARLDDPRQYTVDRNIRDLEAIRERIRAHKLILIGDSWGAMLAAYYMAAHPDHCAKAIFGGPGALDQTQIPAGVYSDAPMARAAEAWFATYRQRYRNLQQLIDSDPIAAHRALPDREADAEFDTFVHNSQTYLVCDPAKFPADSSTQGMGWWSNTMISLDLQRHPQHPLAVLARNRTPVLILRGGCDYIHWDAAYQYKKTFPNSTLLYVPRAGHAFCFDQPELYIKTVQAFLLDQPLPTAPYTRSEAPPRETMGK